jgi:hypothetical protein
MHVARPQDAPLDIAKLVEHEQWVVAGAAKAAIIGAAFLLAVGRAFLLLVPFLRGGSGQDPHEFNRIMPGNGVIAYCRHRGLLRQASGRTERPVRV